MESIAVSFFWNWEYIFTFQIDWLEWSFMFCSGFPTECTSHSLAWGLAILYPMLLGLMAWQIVSAWGETWNY